MADFMIMDARGIPEDDFTQMTETILVLENAISRKERETGK